MVDTRGFSAGGRIAAGRIVAAGVTVLSLLALLTAGATSAAQDTPNELPPQGAELISADADGVPGPPGTPSTTAAVSATGRWVAFESRAALDPLAVDGMSNIYVRDRDNPDRLVLLTRGMMTAFAAIDLPADGPSKNPSISADGRFVAFDTAATNLSGVFPEPGQTAVAVCDRDPDGDGVFDERRLDGSVILNYTMMPTRSGNSDRAASISANAGTVVWTSDPSVSTPSTRVVTLTRDEAGRLITPAAADVRTLLPDEPGWVDVRGGRGDAEVSADGRHVVFPVLLCTVDCAPRFAGPPLLRLNGARAQPPIQTALYAADLDSGAMSRMDDPVAAAGVSAAAVSGDGATVAFVSDARLWLVRRGADGAPASRIALPTTQSPTVPTLSADGRYLAYATTAGVPVVRDLVVDEARSAAGQSPLPDQLAAPRACQLDGTPCAPVSAGASVALAADGSVIAFDSDAADLVAGDDNDATDVFARPFRPNLLADPVDFGSGYDPIVRAITLRHNGFGPLRIDSVAAGGAFDVYPEQSCAGSTLYETGECVVSVRFTPTSSGEAVGELAVTTSTGVWRVTLRGERGPEIVELTAAPDRLVFGGERLVLTPSEPETVVLTAGGTTLVTVRAVRLLAGPDLYPQDYQVDGCVDAVLAPGQSCAVTVVAVPTGGGPRPGALLIETDDPATTLLVGLASTGIRPTLVLDPAVTEAGRVVTLTATGFPSGRPVTLVGPGIVPPLIAGPDGRVTAPLVVLANAVAGLVPVTAVGPSGGEVSAEALLLVGAGSYQPPEFLGRR